MSSLNPETYDDRLLTRYLLGALSPEESERLDELSIVDDEFASRLNALENDLVDAYVRNELPDIDLQKFKSFYLSTSKRRRRAEFAEALQGFRGPSVQAEEPALVVPVPSAPATTEQVRPHRSFFSFAVRPWAYAAIALVGAMLSSYFIYRDAGLRRQLETARAEQRKSFERQRELQQKLNQQQAAIADANQELEQARSSVPNLEQLKTVALLLPPPTRGAARISTLSLPAGTEVAVLMLTMETDDFPEYGATLKDPVTRQVLWKSGILRTSSLGEKKAVSISFPAGLLKQQNYVAELTGVPNRGAPESIGSYAFRAVVK